MASSSSETCSADEGSEPESTELDRPLVREKEWHEHVAMALINLSEKVHSLLHRYDRWIPTMKMIKTVKQNETIPMELMKIAVIVNPIHLFTHLANEWMPPYTEIKYLHPTSKSQVQDRRKSCLRIELLLTHMKRGIDHLPFILFSTGPVNNASIVLKRYRSFVTRSLVEIRTQLINGDEKASDEDLAEYFLGLGRLLTEVRKIHHINKQSEDYRLKLNAMTSKKKIDPKLISSPLIVWKTNVFRSYSAPVSSFDRSSGRDQFFHMDDVVSSVDLCSISDFDG